MSTSSLIRAMREEAAEAQRAELERLRAFRAISTTAVHEAAHAAVAMSLGVRVREVYINGDGSAAVRLDDTTDAIGHSTIAAAGSIAAKRLLAEQGREDGYVSESARAGSDERHIFLELGDDRDAIEQARNDAHRIVNARWRDILHCARALQECHRMTGDEAARMMGIRQAPHGARSEGGPGASAAPATHQAPGLGTGAEPGGGSEAPRRSAPSPGSPWLVATRSFEFGDDRVIEGVTRVLPHSEAYRADPSAFRPERAGDGPFWETRVSREPCRVRS